MSADDHLGHSGVAVATNDDDLLTREEVELARRVDAVDRWTRFGSDLIELELHVDIGQDRGRDFAVDPADVGALSLQKYSSPQERLQAAQRAVTTHPDDAGAWRLLALALKAGPEEMEAMRHALALEPNDPLMLNNLAWAESQAGQVAAALEKAERAVNFVPWSFSYVDTLAVVLMKSHRCAEALVTAQRAVDLLPENLPAASRAQFEGGVERIRTGCHPAP